MKTDYDVIIIGSGPTGLAAAVYTGREDLRTLVLEADVVGGMIATTEIVDNYPGFAHGVSGIELAESLAEHARRFGAEIVTAESVTGLASADGAVAVKTNKRELTARAVLVATGAHYRHLEVPGEKELIGRGVHYCATCDGPLYRGKDLVVVGGGNSALQEGLFLAKFAGQLTYIVRGPEFKGTHILIRQLTEKPNVKVQFDSIVTEVNAGDGKFEGVTVRHKPSDKEEQITADGLFAFIGLIPNSDFLKGSVDLDERGFVPVDKQFGAGLPGVFAAGDVCRDATGQIAGAVGEGVAAALQISKYLGHPV